MYTIYNILDNVESILADMYSSHDIESMYDVYNVQYRMKYNMHNVISNLIEST